MKSEELALSKAILQKASEISLEKMGYDAFQAKHNPNVEMICCVVQAIASLLLAVRDDIRSGDCVLPPSPMDSPYKFRI